MWLCCLKGQHRNIFLPNHPWTLENKKVNPPRHTPNYNKNIKWIAENMPTFTLTPRTEQSLRYEASENVLCFVSITLQSSQTVVDLQTTEDKGRVENNYLIINALHESIILFAVWVKNAFYKHTSWLETSRRFLNTTTEHDNEWADAAAPETFWFLYRLLLKRRIV